MRYRTSRLAFNDSIISMNNVTMSFSKSSVDLLSSYQEINLDGIRKDWKLNDTNLLTN